ncbi:MAG: prepilin-type N-terminal cleavage/methylation domain-containing protein [Candidatus Omnitrophica bacterium]|nr:prepilin-type N-terminal cleavage/methylation domain-containing protein [Candidatus Omnitrophota bacterium]
MRRGQRGFLLLETLVALVILGLGLMAVGRSFLTAGRAVRASEGFTRSIWIARQELAEAELLVLQGRSVDELPAKGTGSLRGSSWTLSTEPSAEQSFLPRVRVEGLWKNTRSELKTTLDTYLSPRSDSAAVEEEPSAEELPEEGVS